MFGRIRKGWMAVCALVLGFMGLLSEAYATSYTNAAFANVSGIIGEATSIWDEVKTLILAVVLFGFGIWLFLKLRRKGA